MVLYGILRTADRVEFSLTAVSAVLREEAVLCRAQTYAFTVLGLSELFHAVGMRNVEVSIFRSGLFTNPLMAVAFAAGLCLQFAVTEIPFLVDAFRTAVLSPGEWGFLLLLAAVPLLAHEVFALVKTITKR